jgi:hypothetical protein
MSDIADEFERRSFECAFEAYRADPSDDHALRLAKFLPVLAKSVSTFGPMFAIYDVMRKRGQAESTKMRIAMWTLRKTFTVKRPGWNDYCMVRWQLTKERAAVEEIHRRSCHLVALPANILTLENPIDAAAFLKDPWYPVAYSARWMVNSVRADDPEFAAAIEEVEKSCLGCHLSAQSS